MARAATRCSQVGPMWTSATRSSAGWAAVAIGDQSQLPPAGPLLPSDRAHDAAGQRLSVLRSSATRSPARSIPMPFKWGLAINNSHFGLIQNNDLNNWAGSGLVTITGAETQNVIEGNRVMRINGNGWREDNFDFRGRSRRRLLVSRAGQLCPQQHRGQRSAAASTATASTPAHGRMRGRRHHAGVSRCRSHRGRPVHSVNLNCTPFREFRGNEAFACQNGIDVLVAGNAVLSTPATTSRARSRISKPGTSTTGACSCMRAIA